MSNVNGMVLNAEQVLGSSVAILTAQRKLKEFKDGKSTEKIIGARFDVVSPIKCFDSFSVKIEGCELLNVSDEEIVECCATLNPIFVKFEGFKGKLYNGYNNSINVSCSAKNVTIVNREEAMSEIDKMLDGDN
jgi:hypothetical protein